MKSSTPIYQPLCRLADIPPSGAKGVGLELADGSLALIVVNSQNGLRVYVNACPHTGVALNWVPDQFFDLEGEYLQCTMHGALFRPEDGYCIHGPCLGRNLEPRECVVRGQDVCLVVADGELPKQVGDDLFGDSE